MTPAISVWTKSSVEYIGVCPHPYPPPPNGEGGSKTAASFPLPPMRQRAGGSGWGHSDRLGSSARMLEDDVGLAPILVGLGVAQDQNWRRPVVPIDAIGAGKLHIGGGPALEGTGLERLHHR